MRLAWLALLPFSRGPRRAGLLPVAFFGREPVCPSHVPLMYACTCVVVPREGRGLPQLYSPSSALPAPRFAMVEDPLRKITKPTPLYPRTASMTSLQSLIMEETPPNTAAAPSSAIMLNDGRGAESLAPTVPTTTEGLLLMALQERLTNPRTTAPNNSMNLNLNGEAGRMWQSLLLGLPLLPQLPGGTLDLNYLQTLQGQTHPLWHHNLCAWPGCNQPCETLTVFLQHLSQAHTSDERTTADMKAQVELVDTLEHRLTKERNKLQAMMQHLQMKHSPDTTTPTVGKVPVSVSVISQKENIQIEPASPMRSPKQEIVSQPASVQPTVQVTVPASVTSAPPQIQISTSASMTLGEGSSNSNSAQGNSSPPSDTGKNFMPRRSRISDKTVLPISADIQRNREFYRSNDVRPPYTYASLIRQAIMESPECQLTLNEIYTWFTDTFAYFRRNAATWKNAVRHNLSLHKCFQRVEQNVKGAVWTVDDSEFYRRRPQRSSATRSQPNTPIPEDIRPTALTLTQRLLDHTAAINLMEGSSKQESAHEGLQIPGGLEGVLSFLGIPAGQAHDPNNPLALLSAAAAASEHSSARGTPICAVKDEVKVDVEDVGQYNVSRVDLNATSPSSSDVSTTRRS